MMSLILGNGEVGQSLKEVLDTQYICRIGNEHRQPEDEKFEIMHICFPFTDKFESEVKRYQEKYKPKFTVIHSTTPVGTSRKLNATHHPVTGMHPNLARSFLTFTQFLSGKEASSVADYFRRAGMKVYLFDKQETTELGKISQTTFYALMIEYVKELNRECENNGLSFTEVYTMMSQAYNDGYEKLNREEYKMPLLTPIMTPQSGHCTIPNLSLWDNVFTKFIKELNKKYEK